MIRCGYPYRRWKFGTSVIEQGFRYSVKLMVAKGFWPVVQMGYSIYYNIPVSFSMHHSGILLVLSFLGERRVFWKGL